VGVSPLQLVNLHKNRRYFVIKLHTWFCLSYFLKTNIKCYCIYQNFMSINSFFQHRICFSIQPPDYQWDKSRDYTCYSQWPVTHFSTFYQFILNMLFNYKIINSTNIKQTKPISEKLSQYRYWLIFLYWPSLWFYIVKRVSVVLTTIT
jgi:hypothetical protein